MSGRVEFTPDPNKDWCIYVADVDDNGETSKMETDLFYHSGGELILACSENLPAELMAKALHAAWLVLEPECQKRFG